MNSMTWVLSGLGTLALPSGASTRTRTNDRARRTGPKRGPARVGVAGAAVAVACVVAGGPWPGAAVAMVLCPIIVVLLRRASARPPPARADPALPLCLDLVAAALRSGRPLPDALTLAAPAARVDVAQQLTRVAALLRLGADPAATWVAVARGDPVGPLAAVGSVAARSSESGIKLAGAFERIAIELRVERAAVAAMRAHRAGVFAMAPLASSRSWSASPVASSARWAEHGPIA
jgi:Flp pilus assembly protein TadB